jgi:pimeloyl-ACP methyl ester carboxylesterase
MGASCHLLDKIERITLATHIKDISNLLFYEDLQNVILVGHSYGGMVITGVAAQQERYRISHLVYLDAYLPSQSESEIDFWPPDQKQKYNTDLASGIKFCQPFPPSTFGISDQEMSKWVEERLTPQPYSTYEDPPPIGIQQITSSHIACSYIHCNQGNFALRMKDFAARALKLGWNVHTMEAAHDVMITRPKELAEILLEISDKK